VAVERFLFYCSGWIVWLVIDVIRIKMDGIDSAYVIVGLFDRATFHDSLVSRVDSLIESF
jgi:hypothetical protein